ncbi:hypothetical protein CLW00_104274 [Mongoliibacter ruber]|uniref:Uncharacterized protein n=1 Tax=Mongoliibacter ruber TaxID=1750599 RepID=A0A2T0WPJ6_9BACT|nr:hypothetical protein CLW00_104274 [Mongoliibacter ruber]
MKKCYLLTLALLMTIIWRYQEKKDPFVELPLFE